MSIVAVAGDLTTTTSVVLASVWRRSGDAIVIEADPSGGDLAAWFDIPAEPSLSALVTQVPDAAWPEIQHLVRVAECGVRLISAPASATEATAAVGESATAFVPAVAAVVQSPRVIVDCGRLQLDPTSHPFVAAATVTVVVHRQATQSSRAAAVRLRRLAEQVDSLATLPAEVVVAVVGAAPFDVGEISEFIATSAGETRVVGLPVDDLSAAVVAGRTGVSARRLGRLPLFRAASRLAADLDSLLEPATRELPEGVA